MQLRLTSRFLTRGVSIAAALPLFLVPGLHAQPRALQHVQQATLRADSDTHVVSSAELQQQAQAASAERQKNIETLTQFLSSPTAVRAMKSHQIDPSQVTSAISNLSDAELANLSARAAHAQQDFAAGSIDNNTLLIIILILVAVVLIAVIR